MKGIIVFPVQKPQVPWIVLLLVTHPLPKQSIGKLLMICFASLLKFSTFLCLHCFYMSPRNIFLNKGLLGLVLHHSNLSCPLQHSSPFQSNLNLPVPTSSIGQYLEISIFPTLTHSSIETQGNTRIPTGHNLGSTWDVCSMWRVLGIPLYITMRIAEGNNVQRYTWEWPASLSRWPRRGVQKPLCEKHRYTVCSPKQIQSLNSWW
jgi:hypothetical protein